MERKPSDNLASWLEDDGDSAESSTDLFDHFGVVRGGQLTSSDTTVGKAKKRKQRLPKCVDCKISKGKLKVSSGNQSVYKDLNIRYTNYRYPIKSYLFSVDSFTQKQAKKISKKLLQKRTYTVLPKPDEDSEALKNKEQYTTIHDSTAVACPLRDCMCQYPASSVLGHYYRLHYRRVGVNMQEIHYMKPLTFRVDLRDMKPNTNTLIGLVGYNEADGTFDPPYRNSFLPISKAYFSRHIPILVMANLANRKCRISYESMDKVYRITRRAVMIIWLVTPVGIVPLSSIITAYDVREKKSRGTCARVRLMTESSDPNDIVQNPSSRLLCTKHDLRALSLNLTAPIQVQIMIKPDEDKP